MRRVKTSIGLCLLFAFFSNVNLQAQQKYSLVVPGDPSAKSEAEITGNKLTIISSGQKVIYTRASPQDPIGGAYHAYYSADYGQYVRFPVSGQGNMQIGTVKGLTVAWRESQMRVSKMGGSAPATGTPSLVGGSGGPSASAGSLQPAQVTMSDGSNVIALVDDKGQLQMFRASSLGKWETQKLGNVPAMVPNSALGLVSVKSSQLPAVLSINAKGQLWQLNDGKDSLVLKGKLGSPELVPGSPVSVTPNALSCFVCDQKGAIWEYRPLEADFHSVESRQGLVPAGAHVAALNDHIFVIDLSGNLVGYNKAGSSWSKPFLVASGFHSGGAIANWQGGGLVSTQKAIVSVNKKGNPQMFLWENSMWKPEILDAVTLSPGAPIGISNQSGNFVLSFVDSKGNWVSYQRSPGLVASWTPSSLSGGFSTGAPVMLAANGVNAFSIDRSGRLIAANFARNTWNLSPFQGALRFAPRFRQREVIPNPPIPPVEVILKNDHKETLVVRVFDRRDRKKKHDVSLRPGAATRIKIDRDSGGIEKSSVTLVGPRGGGLQDSRTRPIPPKSLYDVVVFEHKVTSQFFDRTQPRSKFKKTPDSEQKSLVSIGVFPIPAGGEMTNGSQLSAYRMAQQEKNPGAAAKFGPIKQ